MPLKDIYMKKLNNFNDAENGPISINGFTIFISSYIHNINRFLENKKYNELPHSVLLAKRLAQCLTNNLPSGLH